MARALNESALHAGILRGARNDEVYSSAERRAVWVNFEGRKQHDYQGEGSSQAHGGFLY
jgi:hypothetical protein